MLEGSIERDHKLQLDPQGSQQAEVGEKQKPTGSRTQEAGLCGAQREDTAAAAGLIRRAHHSR